MKKPAFKSAADKRANEKSSSQVPTVAEINRLQQELRASQQKVVEYQAGWQRAQADYANLKKRAASNSVAVIKYAQESLILDLLPVVDNLQNAAKILPADLRDNGWVKGINLIKQQLEKLLMDNKVTPIKTVGEEFDPHYHEAVAEVKAEKKGIVVEEVLRGYKLDDKVIRAAKVKVGK